MSDIFISYARDDRPQAKTLAQGLEAQGWTVWWDRTIPAGRIFDEVIEEALDAAKSVIVLWSEKSVKSDWVRTEAQVGADRKILIPVRIENVRIPLAFRRIQAADLIGWDGSYTAPPFQELVSDITTLLGPSPKAEEKRQQAEVETKRKAEEERQKAEAEAKREAEEKQQKAEAEAKRKAEEKRKRDEAEAKRKAEEERQQAEAEAKCKAEEERQQAEAEAKRKAEEERQQAEAEAKRKAEEERKKAEAEAKRKAEEKRKRDEAKAKREAEEKRKQAKIEAKRKDEEKRQKAEAEAKRKDAGASELTEVIPTPEPIPDEFDHSKPTGLETEKAWSKNQKTKVLAAICIVILITIVSIGIFFKYSQPMTYSLTTTGGVGGSVTKNPNKTSYNKGDSVTLEAVPNTGYSFASWSGDLSGSTNPATLVMNADKLVSASFALKTYSLTATAVDGSVKKRPDQASYNHGEMVTLEAVPNKGYSFKNWSGDLSGSNNPAKMVMNADKSVTASFALKTYSLTARAVGGSVTKSPDKTSYKHGETVTLEAVPNTGYSFASWSGDLSGSTNPATLVMDADKSVTASVAALKAGDIETNSIGMKLVYIPAGSFMMGSSDSAAQLAKEYDEYEEESVFVDEFPQHQVRISKGFWMGQTEVTQGQYKSVMNAQPWSGMLLVQESASNPAVRVTWDEAAEFCRKLSQQEGKTYRLPTEAEWEYACRAGTTTRFSFGDSDSSVGDYAWFGENAYEVDQKYAHPVGQKKPNPWGLYDMHGNASEMCSDWYDPNYYSNSPSVDPKGPSSGDRHSRRSGCWLLGEDNLRCSHRESSRPDYRGLGHIGFRVVRSQP